MSPKSFDCLAYKDRVQAELFEALKGLSPEEQIRLVNDRAAASSLAAWWNLVPRTSPRRAPVPQAK